MDFCRNVSVAAGEFHQPEQIISPPCSANLDDLFSTHHTEVDLSLEWLSIFVEDCLTSSGNCLPPTTTNVDVTITDPKPTKNSSSSSSSLHKIVVPGKARSKRKKRAPKPSNNSHFSSWTKGLNPRNQNQHLTGSDTLLLQQAYWLAESELIVAQKQEGDDEEGREKGGQGQARRCSHCLSQRTPQWRGGPMGPKTLCNACGVRYKSGRLHPEYRPAKSPTFVSNLHSNSHKKVLEMRHLHSL